MTKIDHFMYGLPDLDAGVAWATDIFGVEPAYGGEHIGLGTRNALLSLGDTYLELIAPDPAQPLDDNLGGRLAQLTRPGLITWAASGDLAWIASQLEGLDIGCRGPVRTERITGQGERLAWELLFPGAHAFGGRLPFFIDWRECEHPSITNPVAGDVAGFRLSDPSNTALGVVLNCLGLSVSVEPGNPAMSLTITTPGESVLLTSTEQTSPLSLG